MSPQYSAAEEAYMANEGRFSAMQKRIDALSAVPKGWQCPACRRCYSPYVEQCGVCNTPTTAATNSTADMSYPTWCGRCQTTHESAFNCPNAPTT